MTCEPRPSTFVRWCLRAFLSKADVEAVLGHLNEELGPALGTSQPSALRLELKAWRSVLALVPSALRRAGRSFRHIVRDALRALRSESGTTTGIILILTLGISAATVTFSVVDTVVLRPLPFDDDHELVVVGLRSAADAPSVLGSLSAAHYLTFQDHATTFRSLTAVVHASRLTLIAGGEREPLVSVQATASLFDTLRVRPLVGQTFTADHEVDGSHRVAVISHDLWQRRFGGDPAVVGRSIAVTRTTVLGGITTDESLTVLGVMPRGFAYPMLMQPPPDIWTPHVMTAREVTTDAGGRTVAYLSPHVSAIGRLRPGLSLEQAQSEARAIAASLGETDEEFFRTREFQIVPLKDRLVGNVRGWMLLVLGAVTVVMLIACVNVANLQLVRATRRARELSIRASLGATRRQLVASLLAESLLLSLIAAALAIIAATWGIQVAKAALPANLARVTEIGLDLRVLAATISAAVVTGVLFGVVPAWQASREDLVSLLKQGTMTLGVGRRRWRAAFVIAEVAFVSVLLVGATLIISSFVRVTTADLGFDRSNLLFVSGNTGIDAADTVVAIERLQNLPDVTAAGAVALGSPPLVVQGFRSGGATIGAFRAAAASSDTEPLVAEVRAVSDGYFLAAGIPVVGGRVFDDGSAAREPSIVIDERVAEALFGRREAVGADVDVLSGSGGRRTVAAVVRHVSLGGPEQTSIPQVYIPLDAGSSGVMAGAQFLVRTSAPPATVIPAIRAAFPSAATSGTAALQVRPLEAAFRNITADRRFNAGLMSIFGVLAIVIGAAGIYGVMASVVAQQAREMSLRVALGATTGRIVTGVLTQAGRYLVAGLAIGLAAAWWVSRGIASILFEVAPTDLKTYGIVVTVMVTVGFAAALIPARRAARIDPRLVLRSE